MNEHTLESWTRGALRQLRILLARTAISSAAVVVVSLGASAPGVMAMQPTDFTMDARVPPASEAARVVAKIGIRSNAKQATYYVHFRQRDLADDSLMSEVGRQGAAALRPGGTVRTSLTLKLARVPKQAVAVDAIVSDATGKVFKKETTLLFFTLAAGRYRSVSYEQAYAPPKRVIASRSRYELLAARVNSPAPDIRSNILAFGSALPKERVADLRPLMDRLQSRFPHGASEMRKHLAVEQPTVGGVTRSYMSGPGAQPFTVSGRFSFKGVDNQLHPAVNWVARLSWQDPSGDDQTLGYADIQADGSWRATFSSAGYVGQNLLVEYAPSNRFAKLVDRDDNELWWHSTRTMNVPTAFVQPDEYADTSSAGWLLGAGDVFQSAMVFWNSFYRAGVDPTRDEPIRIYFPNSWEKCGLSMPWSCSSQKGAQIWLIPAHWRAYVVQHELAHQLNSQYWTDDLGPAGAHTLGDCVNPLVALVEGFADAVPYWIRGNFASSPALGGFGDIETPQGCVGDWNEMHVAATFWDLMDSHPDGSDRLTAQPSFVPLLVYLMQGRRDSLRFYRQDFQSAFPPADAANVDDVLRQNSIELVPSP